MADIRQILFQDDRHKFELSTHKLSMGPGILCSLTHHVTHPGFSDTWTVEIPFGIRTLGTRRGCRATSANMTAMHRGCLDAAREIVSECQDDPAKFEELEKARVRS